jgi:O-antigen ligase
MAGFAAMGSWYLFSIQRQRTRYVWLTFALFIFTGLHVISSRTGLVTVYCAIFVEGIRYMLVKKAYLKGFAVFCLIGCGAVIAINTVPALKNKVVNTIDDFKHYRNQHNLADWSLTRRLIVLKLSAELIGRHPIVGVSPADSKDSLSNLYVKYQYDIPEKDRITDPHNQYLQYGVDIGIVGIFILLTIIFYPIIKNGKDINPLLLSLLIVSGIGMLFESLLERQYGVSFFMFFWSILAIKPLPSD